MGAGWLLRLESWRSDPRRRQGLVVWRQPEGARVWCTTTKGVACQKKPEPTRQARHHCSEVHKHRSFLFWVSTLRWQGTTCMSSRVKHSHHWHFRLQRQVLVLGSNHSLHLPRRHGDPMRQGPSERPRSCGWEPPCLTSQGTAVREGTGLSWAPDLQRLLSARGHQAHCTLGCFFLQTPGGKHSIAGSF